MQAARQTGKARQRNEAGAVIGLVNDDPPYFSTAGVGIDPVTKVPDNVARRQAWEAAHPGGRVVKFGMYWTPLLGGTPFPLAPGAGPSWPDLGVVMRYLDEAERLGLCPVHGGGQ